MAALVIGPMLRYVSDTEATVWIVAIRGLQPAACVEYEVLLDGVRC